ncbi:helitron helicase-like domain-containing protein [Artemisia annua]|uniref:Helitron helicase-like domain-containing protein n=1 Tax=Artemisia annua TaxID=35608 RepID=A0A2U1N9U8_ARTAN|nr:helitron helicase-like domain-containing protein [Artemisia annua]
MPRRLLRNDFAPFTNTYMHNFTNNNGFEDQQVTESESHLQYNGTLITDSRVSAENDNLIDTMSHHVGPSNVNSSNLDLYGQQQNLSVLCKNQPFHQQSTSIPNGDNSDQINYLGESTAIMSDNLETKKDAPAIPDKRKRRIAAMYRDGLYHAKRYKGIQIREDSHAATECHSYAVYNDVSPLYIDIGDCQYACQYCNAAFWYSERSKKSSEWRILKYTKCCAGGQVYLEKELEPPITARDRINEGNIDDFKIQLYNVVGNQWYDLSSSHTLGAIVFEPDGNSQTDYDIIIEYKDRQPQRINKLHSSYMSLQYPLIFVYGQPGFNTKMTLDGVNASTKRTKLSMNMFYKYQLHERMAESSVKNIQSTPTNKIMQVEANIRDLRPKDRNKIIEAIVYRAWIARDPPDTTEKGCRAILLDKHGVRFTCEGSISTINTSRDWYYTSCTKCSLKVTNDDDIPEKIHSITGKKHIFQFQYNTSSKQVTPDFIFNALLDQPENQKQIQDKASGSETVQEEYTTNAVDVPENQQLALAIQSTPAVTPPPNEISAQVNPTEEQPAEELAPTAKVYTGMQTRSRTDAMQASNIQFSKTVEQTNIEPSEDADINQQNNPSNTLSNLKNNI